MLAVEQVQKIFGVLSSESGWSTATSEFRDSTRNNNAIIMTIRSIVGELQCFGRSLVVYRAAYVPWWLFLIDFHTSPGLLESSSFGT